MAYTTSICIYVFDYTVFIVFFVRLRMVFAKNNTKLPEKFLNNFNLIIILTI